MKEFVSHIDYLIQKHDCVIIPDFGGFVLRRESAHIANDGSIAPPQVSVGFNPELKYNDGLLAESYMNTYSISYDLACKRIGEVVQRLNTVLALRQPVQIGKIGKLLLDDEKRLSFIPNSTLSSFHPETFGLETLDIRRLSDIQEIQKVEKVVNRRSLYQRAFTSVGAAAAAVLIFFVTSTPISENEDRTTQKSGFFADVVTMHPVSIVEQNAGSHSDLIDSQGVEAAIPAAKPAENAISEIAPNQDKVEPVVAPVKEEPKKPVVAEVAKVNKVAKEISKPKYYVIIGSSASRKEAQRALVRFQSQGYRNAAILASGSRTRIYINAFSDKNQAEKYAATFRSNNPNLSDAWVYSLQN